MGCAALVSGCGAGVDGPGTLPLTLGILADGPADETPFKTTEIILNWTGGRSRIYPDMVFDGLDLARFPVSTGGTLADRAADFLEAVRARTESVLAELPGSDIIVRNGDAAETSRASVVHVIQALAPRGGSEAGEGEYDPCDHDADNQALVFAEELRLKLGTCTLDEWVLAFANVAAHETGHMLGFDHVHRGEGPETARALYLEIMLEGHTAKELLREQRFLETLPYCPAEDRRL